MLFYFEKNFIIGKSTNYIISPLLISNDLESNFKINANYFNNFFASKCAPLVSNSTMDNMFPPPDFPQLVSIRKLY